MLKAEALNTLLKLKKDGFIKMTSLHRESAEVSQETTKQWKSQLPNICLGYSLADIYNHDETGIFFQAIPSRCFVWQDEPVARTKVLKECVTVLLTCSGMGRKEKLWLVGRAKLPHRFLKICIQCAFIGTILRLR